MDSIFTTLLQLPLFQGLCQEDFTNILGKVKLHFTKHPAGITLIRNGEPCNKLVYLLKGNINAATLSERESLLFNETMNAPFLIEPYSLFGMKTEFQSTYTTLTDVNLLTIDKAFVTKELLVKYDIIRLNFLNLICSRAQTLQSRLWSPLPVSVKEKIVCYILRHCERWEGEKMMRIKMEDLAANLDNTRLNVSRALNELEAEGLLELKRKEIWIPEAAKLVTPTQS